MTSWRHDMMRSELVKPKYPGHLLWKYATNGCHLVLLLPIYSLWWSLFSGCCFTFGTFALRHCWSTGWVRPTTLTGFTATGTTRFAVDPAFTFIAAEPLPETVTFCHFSCLQCCSFLHQLCGNGPYALICKQMFWASLFSPCGNRHHALVSSLLA